MPEVVRPYRGVSADDRRAERREKLLAACLDVVGRDGVAATTVGAVCDEAGLTKRYFYESFKDREAILAEALDGLHTGLLGRIHTALETTGPDRLQRARATIALLLDAMDDPRMARLYVEAPGVPVLRAARERAYETYAELVATEIRGGEGEAARLAALVFVTGTTQAVMVWLQGGIDLERDEFIDTLARIGV